LPVQRFGGCGDGEAGGEGSGAELGSSAAGCEDGTDGDVFDEVGIDFRALEEGFESAVEEVGGGGVFETAFATFSYCSAEGACYDNLKISCQSEN
jgi:hypothetical protein